MSVKERAFQQGIRNTQWYKEFKQRYGEEPDLNTPHYDYRKAWHSGARPNVRDPSDNNAYHWPSAFKGENHPNRYVNGIDTKTGMSVEDQKKALPDEAEQMVNDYIDKGE